MKLYLVGGAVRDQMLNRATKDFDFAVEAPSYDEMKETLLSRGLLIWQERPEFVTIRGKMPAGGMGTFGGRLDGHTSIDADFTLCRAEGMYHDNRHPSTVTPASLLTDLSRRDFTFNAVAITELGSVIDPFSGRSDLHSHRLNTVGDAAERFTEDPLRILRAVRFMTRDALVPSLQVAACFRDPEIVRMIGSLPSERVREELNRSLSAHWYNAMLTMLRDYPEIGYTVGFQFPRLWFKATEEAR